MADQHSNDPSFMAQMDRVCDKFEAAWRSGQRPQVETFLTGIQDPLYSALLRELLHLELAYRRHRGEKPTPEEYHSRFPNAASLIDIEFPRAELTITAEKKDVTGAATTQTGAREAAPVGVHATADVTLLHSSSMRPPPMTLGGYELLEEIGRGGMGVVYKARQTKLGRLVAVKMIQMGPIGLESKIRRFHLEAEAVSKLDHPNIVPIHEIGDRDGVHFFSMKLVDGGNLEFHLPELRKDLPSAVQLLEVVTRAVHFAHERGILHRDLKPANILLDSQGSPFVTDFGLAKFIEDTSTLTQSNVPLGTPSYMAPEQAAGQLTAICRATDVYALGVILFQILTGELPFSGSTPLHLLDTIQKQQPVRPSQVQPKIPPDLETICLKCLEKEPAQRYASANELADELKRWLNGEPIRARRTSTLRRLWLWCLRPARMRECGIYVFLLAALIIVRDISGFALIGSGMTPVPNVALAFMVIAIALFALHIPLACAGLLCVRQKMAGFLVGIVIMVFYLIHMCSILTEQEWARYLIEIQGMELDSPIRHVVVGWLTCLGVVAMIALLIGLISCRANRHLEG